MQGQSRAACRQGRAHHRRGLRHRPGDGGAVPRRGREGRRDRPQRSGPQGAWAGRRSRSGAGRDRRSALARSGRRGRRRVRPPRHPGQQRRHRRSRQHRDGDARRLAQGPCGQCRGHVSRLPRGGAGDEGDRRRLDRQSLVRSPASSATRSRAPIAPARARCRLSTKSAALHCATRRLQDPREFGAPLVRRTPMVLEGIARAKNPERVREGLARAAPMGRMGKAEEVANTILFLASDESSFTTGGGDHGRRRPNGAVIGWARFASSAAWPPRISFFQAFTGTFSAASRISAAAGNCDVASSASSGDAALDGSAARAGSVGAKPW